MRRVIGIWVVSLLLVFLVPYIGIGAEDVSEARLMRHIRALSVEIGSRPAGSSNSIRAADYIAGELSSYGYQVRFQTFSFAESNVRGTVNVVEKNVIGSKPGRDSDRILVIGAHYDSVHESPGADDNASGVAVMLEVARILAPLSPGITMEFIAFGAEENGLIGAYEYVKSAKAKAIVGMINIDMVGVGKSFWIASVKDSNYLVERALELAKTMGVAAVRERSEFSDHVPFDEAGIPAVFFNRPDNDDIHTPNDTIEKIVPLYVIEVARLTSALVKSLI